MFIEELERKLYQKITIDGNLVSYEALMRKEVQKILQLVLYDKKYKPYKYMG